jgi:hypothetical protein
VASREADSDTPVLKRPAGLPASLVDGDAKKANSCSSSKSASGLLDSPSLVPLVLLFASYVVYLFPERGVAVLLFVGSLATFGPTYAPIHKLLVTTIEQVALLASCSERLCALAKEQVRATLDDPDVKRSFTDACRDSLIESLLDERPQAVMVSCCSQAVTTATLAASQNLELQSVLNIAMRSGVKEALSDSTVVGTFFDVVREGLRDPKMHAAALKGAATAANPLKDFKNPLKDLEVPSLSHSNPLKAVSSTLKEVVVDAEAKRVANASGLVRAPPPTIQGASVSGGGPRSPQLGPLDKRTSHSPDPLEALIAPSRQQTT